MTITNTTAGVKSGQTVEYDTTTGGSGTWTWTEPASEPRPLPTEQWLRGCESALQGSRALRRALLAERGLSAATARRFGIGWDARREVWVLPVRDGSGVLRNVSYRPPRGSGRHPWRIAGRTAERGELPLYPAVPPGNAWVLCAGEWDALATIQAGLPGVTGLIGCRWHSAWNALAPFSAVETR